MYLGLFVLLRLVLKRHSGKVGIADLIVVAIIADASQNGLAGDFASVIDGLLLVASSSSGASRSIGWVSASHGFSGSSCPALCR